MTLQNCTHIILHLLVHVHTRSLFVPTVQQHNKTRASTSHQPIELCHIICEAAGDTSPEDVSSFKPSFTSFLFDPLIMGVCVWTVCVCVCVSRFQATRQFLEEINKWTSQHGVSPLSRELAVKFLMARKFDVLRAIELFHSYRVRRYGRCITEIKPICRTKWLSSD